MTDEERCDELQAQLEALILARMAARITALGEATKVQCAALINTGIDKMVTTAIGSVKALELQS